MKPVVLSDVLAVGEFPTPEQIAILAKAGFKSIVNNQPDGEVARFQQDAEVAALARASGLAHAYAPLSSRTPERAELDLYAKAVASLPAPIYAFCYSGARSAAGCALLLTASASVEAIVGQFAAAGFDLSGIRPWLEEERARHAPAAAKAEGQGRATEGAAPPAPAAAAAAAPREPAPVAVHPVAESLANGSGGGRAAADAHRVPELVKGMPKMIVVQPRAAGFGGFAM